MVALWPDRRVDLADGEGEGREAVARRWLPKHPHARDRGQGNCNCGHRPVVGGGAGADDTTQPGLRHQFVEERLCVLLVPGPGGFPAEACRAPQGGRSARQSVGADRPQHIKADVHVLLEVVGRRVAHAPKQAIEHDALKGSGPVLSDVSGAHVCGQGRQPRGGVVFGAAGAQRGRPGGCERDRGATPGKTQGRLQAPAPGTASRPCEPQPPNGCPGLGPRPRPEELAWGGGAKSQPRRVQNWDSQGIVPRLGPGRHDEKAQEPRGHSPVPPIPNHAVASLGVRPGFGGVPRRYVVELLLDL